ncbi:alpha/beta hydrolase family esterase [Paenibacillus luteus]|uniref:alpha/beta hydrolase family esterase n=1 Tax=Paenibacillus luteus TaxID=2545753 RepID=UPI001142059A|nr:hypothetical protein [Paenibacillus luteus]
MNEIKKTVVGNVYIPPGTPNDENRDYLPEAIKGSDMVVNENGNNSRPYPARLKEYTAVVDGEPPSSWYEYVPSSYDGTSKVPLVISLHGGLMTGWGQAIYSSWTLISEREGFIVLLPDASERRVWMVECEKKTLDLFGKPNPEGFYLHTPPQDPDENRDMKVVRELMVLMGRKYSIDESRIYIHGMSMGDIMASQLARHYGGSFAGAAGSAGLTWPEVIWDEHGEVINASGALAVWQSRMEHDSVPLHDKETDQFVKLNREYWKHVNGCHDLPEIRIEGENNFAFYRGELADYVYHEVKNRDHGQTFDDAELVWDYLFSGVRRDQTGIPSSGEPLLPRRGDGWAIALADGSAKAYVHNRLISISGAVFKHRKLKYHGLNGDVIVRGEYFMVPVSFAASLLGGTLYVSEEGRSAEIYLDHGVGFQFAQGSVGCVAGNRVQSMSCEAIYREGELYIPIEWIFQRHYNRHVTSYGDVLYMTDHYAELSQYMAELIRDEIL